jgi:hypothetical protein
MEEQATRDALFKRMIKLEFDIAMWSQSNPGAVMHLRDMQKELETIKRILFSQK